MQASSRWQTKKAGDTGKAGRPFPERRASTGLKGQRVARTEMIHGDKAVGVRGGWQCYGIAIQAHSQRAKHQLTFTSQLERALEEEQGGWLDSPTSTDRKPPLTDPSRYWLVPAPL